MLKKWTIYWVKSKTKCYKWKWKQLKQKRVAANQTGKLFLVNFGEVFTYNRYTSRSSCSYMFSKKRCTKKWSFPLTLLWRRPLSYRNQSTDLRNKSMDWFLYDNGLRHERVKDFFSKYDQIPWKQRIWSHLLNISLMENLIFCVVNNSFFSFLQYCKETRKTVFLYYLFFLARSSVTKDVNGLTPTRSRSSPAEV